MRLPDTPLHHALFLAIICAVGVKAAHIGSHLHRNHTHALTKRVDNVPFSYYYVSRGEVACGGWYKDTDMVCTIDLPMFHTELTTHI